MKIFIFSCACVLAMVAPSWALNIAWLSLHATDAPGTDATNQGFTTAPDQGYVNLMRNNGHTVTRFVASSPTAGTPPAFASQLNNFDLIINSRQINSADYGDPNDAVGAAERAYWHGVTKPMIFMSGYALRNNRLQFFTGDTIPDVNNQGPVTLNAVLPSHPIFQGVTLDGSNNMQFATYPISTPSGNVYQGLSLNTNPIAGGGTVLARSATPGTGLDGTLIAHWPTGSQIGNSTLAAPRMSFMSGTREPVAPNNQVPVAGVKDLTPAGDQLFLNAICFMATCGPPLVAGDTNGNGVGGEFPADFDPIRNNFRKTVTSRAAGDLVTNGRVDFADFRQWKAAHLGMGGSLEGLDLSFVTNVPEPSTAILFSSAVVFLIGMHRRGRNDFGIPKRGIQR